MDTVDTIDEKLKKDIVYINDVINVVSMVSAFAVVAMILYCMFVDKKLMDRVSIRFTFAISVVDFLRGACNFNAIIHEPSGPLCPLVESFTQWLSLFYLFLNVAIAFNLQLVFLNGATFNPRWERAYWAVSVGMATLLSGIPLTVSLMGHKVISLCSKDELSELGYIWEWFFYLFWVLITCIYCSVVVVLIIAKIQKNENNLSMALQLGHKSSYSVGGDWRALRYNSVIKLLIRRVSLYCIIPVVTHMGYFIDTVYRNHTKKEDKFLTALMLFTLALPGTLNFIAFLLDPSFQKAVKSIRQKSARATATETLELKSRLKTTSTECYSTSFDNFTDPELPIPKKNNPTQYMSCSESANNAVPDLREKSSKKSKVPEYLVNSELNMYPDVSTSFNPNRSEPHQLLVDGSPVSVSFQEELIGDEIPPLIPDEFQARRISAFIKCL